MSILIAYCDERLDKGRTVNIIYLDFVKAFDILFHSIFMVEEI